MGTIEDRKQSSVVMKLGEDVDERHKGATRCDVKMEARKDTIITVS